MDFDEIIQGIREMNGLEPSQVELTYIQYAINNGSYTGHIRIDTEEEEDNEERVIVSERVDGYDTVTLAVFHVNDSWNDDHAVSFLISLLDSWR